MEKYLVDLGNAAETILFGGFSALVLGIFLVQTIREAFNLAPRFIPVAAIVVGVVLMLMATYLPEDVVYALGAGLAIAAGISMSVRYVKNGEQSEQPARNTAERVQGNDSASKRNSRTTRKDTTKTSGTGGHTSVRSVRQSKQRTVE